MNAILTIYCTLALYFHSGTVKNYYTRIDRSHLKNTLSLLAYKLIISLVGEFVYFPIELIFCFKAISVDFILNCIMN